MDTVTDFFINVEFARSLVTTFLGAMLAIVISLGTLWLTKANARRVENARRADLAAALCASLKHNLELAQTATSLEEDSYFKVNLDLSLFESTKSLKYDIFSDIQLSRDVDEVAWEMATLHKLIGTRFEAEYSGTVLAFSGRAQLRASLASLIRESAAHVLEYEKGKAIMRRLEALAQRGRV